MRKDSQILLFYQNAEIKRSKEYVNIFLFLYNFYTMGGICQFQNSNCTYKKNTWKAFLNTGTIHIMI